MLLPCWILASALFLLKSVTANILPPISGYIQRDPMYWNQVAQNELQLALRLKVNNNVAKNVIFFLGDGLSIPTCTATRILRGQKLQLPGEEGRLNFETFPHVALIKTYNVDRQVPDSAATATAYLCGVKANYETVGVNAQVPFGDCGAVPGNEVDSIMNWAQEAGKDTGFVTTARVTHASPAGLFAHSASRYWESEQGMPANASQCKDIARQLVEDLPGRNAKVILGGGRRQFLPVTVGDNNGKRGIRKDGKDLLKHWAHDKISRNLTHQYITTKQQLADLNVDTVDSILGLFDWSHMQYEVERDDSPQGQPSIAEMTVKAIQRLRRNPKGYFLFVEGGRIDHGHHDGVARRALEDTIAMDDAVAAAVGMTSESDTLIIVTADHAHVMTINGYPVRANSILGLGDLSDVDHMPYTTLMYTNGPGFNSSRPNLTETDTTGRDFKQAAAVPRLEETHGGDDVAIYARGPLSHLFHGLHEQNYIPHALAYASCIGRNVDHCNAPKAEDADHPNESAVSIAPTAVLLALLFYLTLFF